MGLQELNLLDEAEGLVSENNELLTRYFNPSLTTMFKIQSFYTGTLPSISSPTEFFQDGDNLNNLTVTTLNIQLNTSGNINNIPESELWDYVAQDFSITSRITGRHHHYLVKNYQHGLNCAANLTNIRCKALQ